MQSADLLRRLGDVDRDLLERRVRRMCQLRADGDIDGLMDYADPGVRCFLLGHWSLAIYSRTLVGKEEVGEAYRQVNIEWENLGSVIHELLIDGDRVAIHRTTTIRNRGAGHIHTFDVIDFIRFRAGLVVEFSEYPDCGARAALDARS